MHLAYQTTCIDCLPFCLWNISSDAGRISSFENANKIKIVNPDGSSRYFCLDRQQTLELTIEPGAKIYSKFCVSGSGEGDLNAASQFEFVPEYIADPEVGFNVSRSGSPNMRILSFDATSVDIYFNDVLQNTVTLTPGEVTIYVAPTGNGNYYLQANGNIIVQKTSGTTNDSGTVLKPSDDIIGWSSTAAYISSRNGGNAFDAYHVNTTGATSQNANNPNNILNFNDFGNFANTEDEFYEPTSALRIIGTNLYGQSRGDSDGGNETAFLPLDFARDTHLIPQHAEFVAMVSDQPAVILVTEADGTTQTVTLTKSSTDPEAPYSARIGAANGISNFDEGMLLESDVPIHVVYQADDADAFSSSADETISFGYNKN